MVSFLHSSAAVVMSLTVLIGGVWQIGRWTRRLVRAVDHLEAMPARLGELATELDAVRAIVDRELTPNGGGSMKDKVNATAIELATLRAEVDAHIHRK